jgi:iron complex outermembrane receptor protein
MAKGAVVQEVVVTARKVTENAQSVPAAITAVSAAQLKNESVKTVGDLQGLVPGLQLQQALSDPQSLLFLLRGREQSDVALPI